MIIGADINGFVFPTCRLYRRDNVSSVEGASGTVGKEEFIQWVKDCLVPHLGNYVAGEPRSIVIMDNARFV